MQTIEVASALAGHGVALGCALITVRPPRSADGRLIQPFREDGGAAVGLPGWPIRRSGSRSPKIAAFRYRLAWILACATDDPAVRRYRDADH